MGDLILFFEIIIVSNFFYIYQIIMNTIVITLILASIKIYAPDICWHTLHYNPFATLMVFGLGLTSIKDIKNFIFD